MVVNGVLLGPGVRPVAIIDAETGREHAVAELEADKPVTVEKRVAILPPERLLAPGAQVKLIVEPKATGGQSGATQTDLSSELELPRATSIPEVTIVDHCGREWVKCESAIVRASTSRDSDGLFGKWFEKQSWFPAFDQWVFERAQAGTGKHPARASIWAPIARIFWGWRAGPLRGPFPTGLPASWKYDELHLS